MLPCCSLHAGVCTHRVAQGHGLSLSCLVVMSLGVAWCKEVSADIREKKGQGRKTVRDFFRPGFIFLLVLENLPDLTTSSYILPSQELCTSLMEHTHFQREVASHLPKCSCKPFVKLN